MARQKGQKGGHTSLLQRQFMVEWLKKPANFNVIVGKANDDHSAGFGGAHKDFRLRSNGRTFADAGSPIPAKYTERWDGFTCQSRWTSYFKVFRKIRERLDSQTGFGLTESQLEAGLALEEAVEKAVRSTTTSKACLEAGKTFLHSLPWTIRQQIVMGPLKEACMEVLKLVNQFMVEWLKKPANFNVIVGKANDDHSAGFGGAHKDFRLRSNGRTFADAGSPIPAKYTERWDGFTCQSRWTSYFKVFRKIRERLDSQTGFGLTELQLEAGLALEEAVEKACPF
ncbi:hypothetical protein GN958_ATG04073 [Phytophthora infestans]|uniref:Uncharacterized protein n=1 Tax=Phytophthora infestans TaxID=4787 RepID=A0A8S9V2A1_PHYIN|nr:hypothetical protein GN958_ATG04073 [Phytophthora infestans]